MKNLDKTTKATKTKIQMRNLGHDQLRFVSGGMRSKQGVQKPDMPI